MKKFKKLIKILFEGSAVWFKALRLGVAASVEHLAVLRMLDCRTVVDIGANRGQFALVARQSFPEAKIISFEPLNKPADLFESVFSHDNLVSLHRSAIGPEPDRCKMHLSGKDDSSSLLPISELQDEIFPGTSEVGTIDVRVEPLSEFIKSKDVDSPAMLKLDVQGFELDALIGCESLLQKFDCIYCECSFVELYSGQKLVSEVVDWLFDRGFYIEGIYNTSYDGEGKAVQADFLFYKKK